MHPVFGLGKVLYEIATGQDRHDFPIIPAAWARDPQALEFNEVLLRACENDPARRYAGDADGRLLCQDQHHDNASGD